MNIVFRSLACVLLFTLATCAAPLYTNVYRGNNQPGHAGYEQMLMDLSALDPLFSSTLLTPLTKFDPVLDGAVQNGVTVHALTRKGKRESLSGAWESAANIALVVVKASNSFKALYYGVPGVSSDVWDTSGLGKGKHGVSHLSFYTHPSQGDDSVVPEPSTWMMIVGGLSLLIAGRYRISA